MSVPRTPSDVPVLRRQLHEAADDGRLFAQYAHACMTGTQQIRLSNDPGRDATMLTIAERERLAEAELYYVDEDMSDLLDAAYPTMPAFAPKRHDLPSAAGLVVFARPLVVVDKSDAEVPVTGDAVTDRMNAHIFRSSTRIVAVTWGPVVLGPKQEPAAWYTFWSESNTRTTTGDPQVDARLARGGGRLPPLIPDNEAIVGWAPDDVAPDDPGYLLEYVNGTGAWVRMLLCAFRLAGQTNLAETEDVPTVRAERRRTERAALPARDVRVVRLRRHLREARDAAAGSDSSRTYRHRWVVRGHWRNAWYPSQKVHRPTWIAPYLKGPESAPLIGGERVTVL